MVMDLRSESLSDPTEVGANDVEWRPEERVLCPTQHHQVHHPIARIQVRAVRRGQPGHVRSEWGLLSGLQPEDEYCTSSSQPAPVTSSS